MTENLRVVEIKQMPDSGVLNVKVFVSGIRHESIAEVPTYEVEMVSYEDVQSGEIQKTVWVHVGSGEVGFDADLVIYPDGLMSVMSVDDDGCTKRTYYKMDKECE